MCVCHSVHEGVPHVTITTHDAINQSQVTYSPYPHGNPSRHVQTRLLWEAGGWASTERPSCELNLHSL